MFYSLGNNHLNKKFYFGFFTFLFENYLGKIFQNKLNLLDLLFMQQLWTINYIR